MGKSVHEGFEVGYNINGQKADCKASWLNLYFPCIILKSDGQRRSFGGVVAFFAVRT